MVAIPARAAATAASPPILDHLPPTFAHLRVSLATLSASRSFSSSFSRHQSSTSPRGGSETPAANCKGTSVFRPTPPPSPSSSALTFAGPRRSSSAWNCGSSAITRCPSAPQGAPSATTYRRRDRRCRHRRARSFRIADGSLDRSCLAIMVKGGAAPDDRASAALPLGQSRRPRNALRAGSTLARNAENNATIRARFVPSMPIKGSSRVAWRR